MVQHRLRWWFGFFFFFSLNLFSLPPVPYELTTSPRAKNNLWCGSGASTAPTALCWRGCSTSPRQPAVSGARAHPLAPPSAGPGAHPVAHPLAGPAALVTRSAAPGALLMGRQRSAQQNQFLLPTGCLEQNLRSDVGVCVPKAVEVFLGRAARFEMSLYKHQVTSDSEYHSKSFSAT